MSDTKRTSLRGVITQDSLPPLNLNGILQVLKTNIPTVYLTMSRYSSGRKISIIYRTVRKLIQNKWILSVVQESFRTHFNSPPPLFIVPRSLSQCPHHCYEKNKNRTSPLTGSGKGNKSGNLWFLLLDIF